MDTYKQHQENSDNNVNRSEYNFHQQYGYNQSIQNKQSDILDISQLFQITGKNKNGKIFG
jgi:hypothetical protein